MNETEYDQGANLSAIYIKAKDSSDDYAAFDMDSYRQEDANTLYQYFIKEAVKNASIYGAGDVRKLPAPIQLKNTTLTTEYTETEMNSYSENDTKFNDFASSETEENSTIKMEEISTDETEEKEEFTDKIGISNEREMKEENSFKMKKLFREYIDESDEIEDENGLTEEEKEMLSSFY